MQWLETLLRRSELGIPVLSPKVWGGCPVWGCQEWVGTLYDRDTKPAQYLRQYSKYFSAIELNATHYGIPSPEQILHWRSQVGSEFRFCPKWPQTISHQLDKQNAQLTQRIKTFLDRCRDFGNHLGLSFLQLPPSYNRGYTQILLRFLEQIPQNFPLAIEFRHASWFEAGILARPISKFLAQRGMSTVITDVAGRRDVRHSTLTTSQVLVRFIGNDDAATDEMRLQHWSERLDAWKKHGAQAIYFFTHQPDNANAPALFKAFCEATRTPLLHWNQALEQNSSTEEASSQMTLFHLK